MDQMGSLMTGKIGNGNGTRNKAGTVVSPAIATAAPE